MKVLAADDDPLSLKMLQSALKKWGCEVVVAKDGAEAWRALLEDLDISVAVIDWNMPGMDGVHFCRLAREAFEERSLHIILLTARADTASLIEGFEAGADDYVTKPFKTEELRARLNVGLRVARLQRMLGDRVLELEAAERRYRELVEDVEVIVWEAEADPWRYGFVSRRASELLGGRVHDYMDDPEAWMSRVLAPDRPTVEAFRQDLANGAAHAACDYRVSDANGHVRFLRDLARQVQSDYTGRQRVRGVTIDVTMQRQAKEQLQTAIKMQADFVSFASHQLRTPLTGMKWMLELALAEPEGSTEVRGYIRESVEASERLISLVNDLLRVARLEGGGMPSTPEACDLSQLTAQVVAHLQPIARKQSHMVTTLGADRSYSVLADVQLLRQVMVNLLSNAIKYTPDGGVIQIDLRRDGNAVRWAVTDNGLGVPEDARPRLFEKFFRAENIAKVETEGTGLGLYMVHLIVERANGRIWYEPVEGGGSRFVLTLPLVSNPPAGVLEPGAAARAR